MVRCAGFLDSTFRQNLGEQRYHAYTGLSGMSQIHPRQSFFPMPLSSSNQRIELNHVKLNHVSRSKADAVVVIPFGTREVGLIVCELASAENWLKATDAADGSAGSQSSLLTYTNSLASMIICCFHYRHDAGTCCMSGPICSCLSWAASTFHTPPLIRQPYRCSCVLQSYLLLINWLVVPSSGYH